MKNIMYLLIIGSALFVSSAVAQEETDIHLFDDLNENTTSDITEEAPPQNNQASIDDEDIPTPPEVEWVEVVE